MQEAFLRLARKPPSLPALHGAEAALASWLHAVTRNCAMELLRGDRRRKARESRSASVDLDRPALAHVEARDSRLAVERNLDRLPADQRKVLALRLLCARGYNDITAITGREVGTVSWHIATGMKVLVWDLVAEPVRVRESRGVS